MPASDHNAYVYGHSVPAVGTATTSSSVLLAANKARRYACLVNNGAVDVFLALGVPAENTKGITLKAGGGSYEMNASNLCPLAIHGITGSSTASVSILEGT